MKQGTPEWYAARLGWFTSSEIYKLLGKGRSGEPFTKEGMKYIYQVAAERLLSDKFRSGEGLEMYLERINILSRAMLWGKDMESYARDEYTNSTGNEVKEIGFIRSSLFGDSPDGVILSDENGEKGTIEIKCPNPSTHMMYCNIQSGKDLKIQYEHHYTQCQGHIIANLSKWCDFISFDPMSIKKIHIIRTYPDKEFQDMMLERLKLAEGLVQEINNDITT